MDHGIVTSVTYEDGVVYCQLRTPRAASSMPGIPVLKPHSGFIQVPSQGDVVTVEELSDGTTFITNVAGNPSDVPDDMKEGELTIQLDSGTLIEFKRNANGEHDLHIGSSGSIEIDSDGRLELSAGGNVSIESSGDVVINGISFSKHTHNYKDSTINDTDSGSGSKSTSQKETTMPR